MSKERSNLPLGIISPRSSEARVIRRRIEKRLPRIETLTLAATVGLVYDPAEEFLSHNIPDGLGGGRGRSEDG